MRSRRKRLLMIAASAFGAVVILMVVAVAVFLLTMPDSPAFESPVGEQQEIPESWFAERSRSEHLAARFPVTLLALPYPLPLFPPPDASVAASNPSPSDDWTESSGLLRMANDGKPFGQERFEIAVEGDSVRLTSTGEFLFKVVLVTVRISFQQELVVGRDGRPRFYRLATQAPFGQDMSLEATFSENIVELSIGSDLISRAIRPDQAIVIGTFSSYTLLPAILAVRGASAANLDVLLFGGPPGTEQGGEADFLPQMHISDSVVAQVTSGNLALDVDAYRLSGPLGDGVLYARGNELLGLTLISADGSIDIWRGDYFAEPILSVSLPPPAVDR